MPRVPKSTSDLKLHGTFREDRHGGMVDAEFVAGVPVMPDDLGPDGEWLWSTIIKGYAPGVLSGQDASALEGAARWWARWRKFDRLIDEAADPYKATCLASIAWKAFVGVASKLGLSPAARASLKFPDKKDKSDNGKRRFFTG